MSAALRIAAKDLKLRIRDQSALIWGILAPLGLAVVFSLLLGGVAGGDSIDVSYAVVNDDEGAIGSGFVDGLQQLDEDGVFSIEILQSPTEAETAVTNGDFDAAFLIPSEFSDAVTAGDPSSIAVIGFVDSPIGFQVATAVAEGFAGEVNGVAVAVNTYFAAQQTAPGPGDVDPIVAAASTEPTPLVLDTDGRASKQLNPGTFYAAAMAVFFLFFTVQFGVIGLIEEKEKGTMPRLLAAPIRASSILLGKVIMTFLLGVISMAVLVIVTTLLPFMDADWGNPIGVALLVIAGVLAAMGVMMLVAAFARTAETAGSIQAVLAFLLGMLGGAFFPISQVGGVLGSLSMLTPHAWFLRGLGDLSGGGGPVDVLPEVGFILVFAVVTAGLSLTRLRKAVTL